MTTKEIQKLSAILRMSSCYKGNKESNHRSRFDFDVDKNDGSINVFNAEKGENLFLWTELCGLASGMGLSHYITFDAYKHKKIVLHIY